MCGTVAGRYCYYITTSIFYSIRVTDSVIVFRALLVLLYLYVAALMLLYLGVTAFIAEFTLYYN